MIKLIGRVKKNKNGVITLNVYSKNLAGEIENKGKKVSLEDFRDGVFIKPGGQSHATIASKKRIQIAITTLMKNKIIDTGKIKDKAISVYLHRSDWGLKEILKKSIGSPLTIYHPKDLTTKKAALRTNGQGKYFIDISSKRLHDMASKKTVKCLLGRKEGVILIRSDNLEARRLTPHSKRRVQICIPKELLFEEEIISLSERLWLPIDIKLNLKSFGLRIVDFYSVLEERKIAEYLIKQNIKVAIKNNNDPFDIYLPEYNSSIEVHNSTPGIEDLITRHRIKAGMVRLRILEADYAVRNMGLKNYFIVINKKWKGGKYIKELSSGLDKKVHIIYSDFRNNEYKNIGNDILKLLKIR